MRKFLLSAGFLLAVGSLAAQAPVKDAATYAPVVIDGVTYNLQNQWLYSKTTSNHLNSLTTDSRGFAVANGKLYISDRDADGPGLQIFNTETGLPIGARLPVPGLFKTEAGGYAPYANNTLRTDAANNLVFMNMAIDLNKNPFQVWVMKDETDTPKKLLDFYFTDGEYPKNAMRVDFASVYGDITSGDAYVLAAISGNDALVATNVYRWDFKDGVYVPSNEYGEPLKIAIAEYFPNATASGTAPFTLPVSDGYFYLDGHTAAPGLYNMSGGYEDGFKNAPEGTVRPQTGANGLVEFEFNGHTFLATGANNHAVVADVPMNSFYLYKMGEGAAFDGIQNLFAFPKAGMGMVVGNSTAQVMPIVELVNGVANIYTFAFQGGLAKYTLSYGSGVSEVEAANAAVVTYEAGAFTASEDVKSLEVFTVTGQKVASANASSIDVAVANGVYIVKVVNLDGVASSQKVAVK